MTYVEELAELNSTNTLVSISSMLRKKMSAAVDVTLTQSSGNKKLHGQRTYQGTFNT
jgi:hypothetical protein